MVAFALLMMPSAQAEATEEFVGRTPVKVLEDNPLAKQFSLSIGLGIFEYKTFGVGGWGMDLTYAAPHLLSISVLGFATVHASSGSTDRRIRPFYDVILHFHLYDAINPEPAHIRIWGWWGNGRYVSVPSKSRDMFSLRGGAFSWNSMAPIAFAGISIGQDMYTRAYVPEYNVERTLSSRLNFYLDAVFPTGNQSDGSNDRIGGRIGLEAKQHNVEASWNDWIAFDIGYLQHHCIGRFVVGLTF